MSQPITTAGQEAFREKVAELEAQLQKQPQVACPVRHYFAPGLYAREISIPKGTAIMGAVHKRQNIVVISKGRLVLGTADGLITMEAPHTFIVQPGAKAIVTTLTDVVWTNFFATDETDPDKLVELLTESKASELMGGKDNIQLKMSGLAALEEGK